MMKILVTDLPRTSRDCPFSIKCRDNNYPSNCKLMMNDEADWEQMTFSFSDRGHYNCILDRRDSAPCPFLMTMNQYNWVKKR